MELRVVVAQVPITRASSAGRRDYAPRKYLRAQVPGEIHRPRALEDFRGFRREVDFDKIKQAQELKTRSLEIANDLAVRPVNFIDAFAVAPPQSSARASENGHIHPAFAAASIKTAMLNPEEVLSVGSGSISHERIRPIYFVDSPLVKIEVKVAPGLQCARDRAKRAREFAPFPQMIDDAPFGCDEVHPLPQAELSHVGPGNVHVEAFRESLLARDPAHFTGIIEREDFEAQARKFDRRLSRAATDFAHSPRV